MGNSHVKRSSGRLPVYVVDSIARIHYNRCATSRLAPEGLLKGQRLEHYVGIFLYTRAWKDFHPDSEEIAGPNNGD